MSPLSTMASQACAACSAAATVAAVSTGVWPTSADEHSASSEPTNGMRSDNTFMRALAVKDSLRQAIKHGRDGQCPKKRRNSRDHRPGDQREERRTLAACGE